MTRERLKEIEEYEKPSSATDSMGDVYARELMSYINDSLLPVVLEMAALKPMYPGTNAFESARAIIAALEEK